MTTSATIPVTVDPHAAAGIEHYGLQAAVDRMIDYARQHLPEVERIEVSLYDRYDDDVEPGIAVDVYSRRPSDPEENIQWRLAGWVVRAFPPEVLEHVNMDYHSGEPHAG